MTKTCKAEKLTRTNCPKYMPTNACKKKCSTFCKACSQLFVLLLEYLKELIKKGIKKQVPICHFCLPRNIQAALFFIPHFFNDFAVEKAHLNAEERPPMQLLAS